MIDVWSGCCVLSLYIKTRKKNAQKPNHSVGILQWVLLCAQYTYCNITIICTLQVECR